MVLSKTHSREEKGGRGGLALALCTRLFPPFPENENLNAWNSVQDTRHLGAEKPSCRQTSLTPCFIESRFWRIGGLPSLPVAFDSE